MNVLAQKLKNFLFPESRFHINARKSRIAADQKFTSLRSVGASEHVCFTSGRQGSCLFICPSTLAHFVDYVLTYLGFVISGYFFSRNKDVDHIVHMRKCFRHVDDYPETDFLHRSDCCCIRLERQHKSPLL